MENTNTEMNPIFQQRHCPNCGGNSFTFNKDKSAFVCDYCDSEFVVEGLNKGIVIHNEEKEEDDDSPVTKSSYSSYSYSSYGNTDMFMPIFCMIFGGLLMGVSMYITNNPDILPVSNIEAREQIISLVGIIRILAVALVPVGAFGLVRHIVRPY